MEALGSGAVSRSQTRCDESTTNMTATTTIATKFQVQLGLVTSNQEDDYWTLEVRDEASRIEVLTLKLSHLQLSSLLGHRPQSDVDGQLRHSARIGMKMENQTVHVAYDVARGDQGWDAFVAHAKHSVAATFPGWSIDDYDLKGYNGHRHKNGLYSLTIRRWVAP